MYEAFRATSVWGLKLLVYESLSATSVCGLKLLVYEALSSTSVWGLQLLVLPNRLNSYPWSELYSYLCEIVLSQLLYWVQTQGGEIKYVY